MGLDMYLEKEIYIWEDARKDIHIKGLPNKEEYKFDINELSKLVFKAAYWRKANQIHHWFVENVQDGEDDCKRYYVDKEQLIELRKMCEKILNEKDKDKQLKLAKKLLPPSEGFFFGTYEYDEWYFQDLKDTVKQLKNVEVDSFNDYYYQASW